MGKYILFRDFLNRKLQEYERHTGTPFLRIDEEFGFGSQIPFEIKFIYKKWYDGIDQRFIEVWDHDYTFFTEYQTYQMFMHDFKKRELFTEELEPLNFENIGPYYKRCAEGFLHGYQNFDNKVKQATSIFSADASSIVQKVFYYINQSISGLASYGFKDVGSESIKVIKKDIWYDSGIKAGEKYKAWFFVLNNHQYFKELFRSHPLYISLYKRGLKIWKEEPGGEWVVSHLERLLAEIGQSVEEEANDIIKSTIEDYMIQFEKFMSTSDYQILISSLKQYFEKGSFPKLKKKLQVSAAVNKKKMGWELNQLYRMRKNETISVEYLRFGKKYISIFENVSFDENEVFKSNLYKYYTTKPKKTK